MNYNKLLSSVKTQEADPEVKITAYNPFNQQLYQEVMEAIQRWNIQSGDILADIGAGTGDYSLAMAKYFPQATVLHVDSDAEMNVCGTKKNKEDPLPNHKIIQQQIDEVLLQPASIKGLICIHALFTFPNPQKVMRQMYKWLTPGGQVVLVNTGRMINVLDWQIAIGWYMIRNHGLQKTFEIFQQVKELSKKNIYIRDMQRKGIFWTHNHQEFCREVQNAGFEIKFSKICFRGTSDFVVAEKHVY